MDQHERQLITDLFHRMRNLGPVEKDREAEDLIAESLRSVPDAPYLLTQTVLVQEMALKDAQERIRELEARAARPAGRSGFLGGFGIGAPAASREGGSRGSVPSVGKETEDRQPAYAGAPMPPERPAPAEPAPRGGSFLGSALSTAAGVAGGLLIGEGLRQAMGWPAHAAASPAQAGAQKEPHYQDANDNDPGQRRDTQQEETVEEYDEYDEGEDAGGDGGDGGIDV